MTGIRAFQGQETPKIVLLFPSPLEGSDYSLEVPLSILSVAAPVHAAGYQVILIDERLHDDPEAELIEAARGAVCLGVSTITGYQLKRAIHLSRLVKEKLPDLPIIWGGYHPSLLPEQSASEPYVDAVVRGQGEVTFQEIVHSLEQGGGYEGILGVTFSNSDGEVITNPPRPFADVNIFPPAPYELLDIERLFRMNGGRRALQYISSQGCPFKCTFCVEPHVYGKWSGRDADKVFAELKKLYDVYHISHISFSDPNYFANRKRVEGICQQIVDEGLKFTWSVTARADQLVKAPQETFNLMAEAGCSRIGIGLESGSRKILALIDKRITPEKAIESNRMLEEAGIEGFYAFMVGFPKQLPEAEDEIWQTLMLIKLMRSIHPNVITVPFYVTPYPGTPIHDIAVDLKLKMPVNTEEWADWESTSVSTTWITEKEQVLVESCNNFYFPFAYPNTQLRGHMRNWILKPVLYPLHWLAAFRCRFDFYRAPVEWRMMQRLSRTKKFRKVGSQINAARGY